MSEDVSDPTETARASRPDPPQPGSEKESSHRSGTSRRPLRRIRQAQAALSRGNCANAIMTPMPRKTAPTQPLTAPIPPRLVPKPKTAGERGKRLQAILAELDKLYPNATCALHHQNAWELLVATILSAQCTD